MPWQTAGGIYLPDSKLGKTNEGEVIAVGPGRVTETGTKIAVNVTVGDTVLLPEYGGTTLTLGDEELSLFRDEDILGKFQVCTAVAQRMINKSTSGPSYQGHRVVYTTAVSSIQAPDTTRTSCHNRRSSNSMTTL